MGQVDILSLVHSWKKPQDSNPVPFEKPLIEPSCLALYLCCPWTSINNPQIVPLQIIFAGRLSATQVTTNPSIDFTSSKLMTKERTSVKTVFHLLWLVIYSQLCYFSFSLFASLFVRVTNPAALQSRKTGKRLVLCLCVGACLLLNFHLCMDRFKVEERQIRCCFFQMALWGFRCVTAVPPGQLHSK